MTYDYCTCTGERAESLVKQLLYNSKLGSACPLPFDEAKL
jgi:ERO1-like protein alpha